MATDRRPDCAVSVILPVLDPGPLLAEQLSALVAQDWDLPWEVLIADNGCTDGSLDVVEEMRHRLPVRVIDARARRGPAYARNQGAAEARGEWLAFCDGDDVASPGWLAALWSARDQGDLVCGACDVTTLNDPAVLKARGGPDYGRSMPQGPCEFLPYATSGNMLVRRALFMELGGWDEQLSYCEDVEFSWRAQLRGQSLVFAPEAVMQYRYRPSTRALFHQVRRYKAAEVGLFVLYRSVGARRPRVSEALGRYWWLLSRGPYVVLGTARASLWCSVAGAVVGRIEGSWRHRVVYL
jgi:glycosyltransferase involved in cell wall biosynthesis